MCKDKSSMLRAEAKEALLKWKSAEKFLNEVSDPALVDFAIYRLEAVRRKYIYLLRLIRQEDEKNGQREVDTEGIE